MKSAFAVGVVALLVAAGANIAEALPSHGGEGGQPFRATCPRGSVLVGLQARAGQYIDAVAPLCVPINSVGGMSVSVGARAGGGGGQEFSLRCSAGEVVAGIFGGSGVYVDRIGIHCRPIAGGHGNGRRPVGGPGGDRFDDQCPSGQVGVGVAGRSGDFVDQIALLCMTVVGPPPPAVQRAVPAEPEPARERVSGHIKGQPGSGKADIAEIEVQILNGAARGVTFELCDPNKRCNEFRLESNQDGVYRNCAGGCHFTVGTEGETVEYDLDGSKRYRIVVKNGRYDLVMLSLRE